MATVKRLPLFITSLSLSSKSAFGVQTRLLLQKFPESFHLHWDSSEFRKLDPRSARIESALCARFSILRGDPQAFRSRALSVLGRSWWRENALAPRAQQWLTEHYAEKISVIYSAPCSIRDSERMKSILERLNRPFVLHLWDIQDKNQLACTAFQWLLQHAIHVFCLTKEMTEYIAPVRQGASIMGFTRAPSQSVASPPPTNSSLRIALLGNCRRYRDGLTLLNEALKIAESRNTRATVVYIGTAKSLRNAGVRLNAEVKTTGYLASDYKRDRVLSECHTGFLPGPFAAPSANVFSRFSIPSRILDYMATGLPILAAVHPDSATFDFMKRIGIKDCVVHSADDFAHKLQALSQSDNWKDRSTQVLDAFQRAREEREILKQYLEPSS